MRRRTDRRRFPGRFPARVPVRFLGRTAIAGAILAQAALLAGCSARAIVPNERDPLRDQIRSLEAEKASLERRIDELNAALAQQAAAANLPPEVLANLPLPIRIVARFGSAVPRSDDPGSATELTVHIDPTDSRERFVQLTGWVDLTVVRFTDDPSNATVLASATFDPAAVRDALRSGLTTPSRCRSRAGTSMPCRRSSSPECATATVSPAANSKAPSSARFAGDAATFPHR
jgi:outer membrane murein-binding lipoprotein Lpp